MAGFDAVVVVDWSSAATPTTGKDSIWWALHRVGDAAETRLENPATRAAAEAQLLDLLRDEIAAGRRVLIGFDFPFGYPEGFADAAFGPGAWRAVWAGLSETVQERPGNVNTRFAAAAEINRRMAQDGPFWGCPPTQRHDGLGPLKPRQEGGLSEWRAVEHAARARGARPKSCWQLSGAGAVGGQVLTGIPAVARLRGALDGAAEIWPFETGLAASDAPVVFAEIYPSLVAIAPREGEPKDAAQVRATSAHFAALARAGRLDALFAAPGAEPGVRTAVATEEAWILGVELFGEAETDTAAATAGALDARLRAAWAEACGRRETAEAVEIGPGAAEAAARALAAGAPVICDGAPVAAGLPAGRAEALGEDAAAWAALSPGWGGAVLALGEGPGAARALAAALAGSGSGSGSAVGAETGSAASAPPAAILAFSSGLDGAEAAKAALAEAAEAAGVALIRLPGAEGGLGLAVATLRVLAAG